MSGVLPPVKENIYIPSTFAFHDDEGKQRAGYICGGSKPCCQPQGQGHHRSQPQRMFGKPVAMVPFVSLQADGQSKAEVPTTASLAGSFLPFPALHIKLFQRGLFNSSP